MFTRAYSHIPSDSTFHATILTGTYPQYNHVDDFGSRLGKDIPDTCLISSRPGLPHWAFVSSVIFWTNFSGSAPGFERGFDVYDAGFHRRRPNEDRYKSNRTSR